MSNTTLAHAPTPTDDQIDRIFLRRIVGVMFVRVNSKCAHQVRPPPTVIQLRRRPLNGSRQDCFGGRRFNLRGSLGNFKIERI
jgi:hypothetical protein